MTKNIEISEYCEEEIKEGAPLSTVKHNRLSTVHPNVILRTPIFTPVAKNTNNPGRVADISTVMRRLSLAATEGYDQVVIFGARLDIETDFRTWVGITRVFERDGFHKEDQTLNFRDFAALCGYPPNQFSSTLRDRLDKSLTRIMSQVITFSKPNGSNIKTHLVQYAEYDANQDTITLRPDIRLWELYRIDHNILLSSDTQEALKRKEVAQCLYMFIEALPAKPHPLSFSRIRDRLMLTTSKEAEANRSISKALQELKNIEYLDYDIVTKNRERYVLIHNRKPTAKKVKS